MTASTADLSDRLGESIQPFRCSCSRSRLYADEDGVLVER